MKILFLVPYPTEGASNRIRIEQYLPYLESRGIKYKVRPFVNRAFYRILYHPHKYLEKLLFFFICTINRVWDIVRAMGYDIVFIHREAYPFGGAAIESALHFFKKRIIFDFDDAIFLPNSSEHNIYIERLKNPGKVAKIVAMSDCITVGNNFLKAYALRYNKNVVVIPTAIDTKKYCPEPKNKNNNDVVIGWIGSNTTKYFLYDIEDVFVRLTARYANLRIKIVGANFYSAGLRAIINKEWRLEDEVKDVHSFDIGVMPMPDNEWTKGKCAFKAVLYMACGIPVVASPVGVNAEIIQDGVNGFLARGRDEWEKKLSVLIENRALREETGRKGRERVLERYSLDVTAPVFYDTLRKAYGKP